ncbi:unnamed protein product [Meloidogyne enterolobii]|uniref:Uncharacterized protein n=1 Tax=Meloidogyne enterolobii TaxID=390850 RepID=A0ACB1AZB1_MELEN
MTHLVLSIAIYSKDVLQLGAIWSGATKVPLFASATSGQKKSHY